MVIVLGLLLLIAAVILGIVVIGLVFKLAWWLLAGLVIGALARLVLPGKQPIGLLATALYGIAGSVIGGVVARRLLHVGGLLQTVVAIGIAALLVAVVGRVDQDRQGPRQLPGGPR